MIDMNGIEFLSLRDPNELDAVAATMVVETLRTNRKAVLCVATGTSPKGVYARLAEHARHEPATFRELRILKLDEWLGLPPDDPGTCEAYIQQHVLKPLGVSPNRYFGFDAGAPDHERECKRVHLFTAELGVDLAILGIGANGHIGLNEPAASLPPFAHVTQLAPESVQHTMLTGARPTGGMTLGMAEILASDRILLIAPGHSKRPVIERLMRHELSTEVPASLLWLHPNVTCFTCSG
jgi:galactosamine-6-phosphate isomerase